MASRRTTFGFLKEEMDQASFVGAADCWIHNRLPGPAKSRVPAAIPHRTFLNCTHPAFLATINLPPPSSFREKNPSNCAPQSFTALAIVRHYHARPVFAQKAYRDEAGINGACVHELLVQV